MTEITLGTRRRKPENLQVHGSDSSQRGAAAVELALVLPVLMALVFGIIGFGRVFSTQIDLSNAAQEGARYAVFAPIVPAPPTEAQVRDVVVAGSSLAPALMTRPGDAVAATGSCTAPGSNITVEARRVVAFNYVLGTYSRTIRGTAVMRCPG